MKERPQIDKETSSGTELSRREFVKGASVLFGALAMGDIKRAEAFLNAEQQEAGPKIEIEIFYTPHGTREDARGLKERIQESDIFIPEALGWNKEMLSIYRGLAEGQVSPPEIQREGDGSFQTALFEAIWDSKKRIELIDVPDSEDLFGQIVLGLYKIKLKKKSASELISEWKEQLTEDADLQRKREEFMLERLLELKKRVAGGVIAELKGKNPVKILLFLGAYHTQLLHALHKKGERVSRTEKALGNSHRKRFYVFRHMDEATRHAAFGKEIGDYLVAKGILENIMEGILRKDLDDITLDSRIQGIIERRIAEKFGPEEIKEVIDEVLNAKSRKDAREILLQKFKEKNIDLAKIN